MKNPSFSEHGVSEMIGSIILISIVVLAVSIFGVFLWSQPPPQKIPAMKAIAWNDSRYIYIKHDGGDAINYGDIKIYVNGTDQTSKFNLSTAPNQPWTNWSIGNILQESTGLVPLSTIQLVYTGSGSSGITLTTFYFWGVPTTSVSTVPPPPLPVTAGFSGIPISGYSPLNVQFTDASIGPVTSWFWEFGDGTTSNAQNPSHQYMNFGKYTVNLTVSNTSGNNKISNANYITICWADNFTGPGINPAWKFVGGSWSQAGGVLSQTSIAAADPKKAIIQTINEPAGSNHTITAKVRVDSWSNGDMARAGVSLFSDSTTGNGYNLLFHYTAGSSNNVQFLDDKVIWSPNTAYTWNTGSWYWFKFKMDTGILYGKVWSDGSSEPASWTYSWNYNTGRIGYPALNGGSADTTYYSTVSFGNVTVCPN